MRMFQELELKARQLFPTPRLHSSYSSNDVDGEKPGAESEDVVGLLEMEKDDDSFAASPTSAVQSVIRRQRRRNVKIGIALFVAGLVLILLGASIPSSRRRPSESEDHGPESWAYRPQESKAEDHYLHIILPVFKANVETCKTLFTGAALNYPTPWIVSWDEDGKTGGMEDREVKEEWSSFRPRDEKKSEGGKESEEKSGGGDDGDGDGERKNDDPTLAKMESILQLLEVLPLKNDNDTVLILGDPETWFQVRPEVLLARYLDIQDQETRRLAKTVGLQAQSLTSKIVFAADKSCPSGTGCLGITAPKTISKTLYENDGSAFYLSHDLLLGRLQDMRPLYQLAVLNAQKAAAAGVKFTEHSIFADLYASQEGNRQELIDKSTELDNTATSPSSSSQQDFGLTLDFSGILRYSPSEDEIAFLRYDFENDHRGGLPTDIAASSPPFWTVTNNLPQTPWSQVPLLINDHTNVLPALIQRPHPKWWKELWFQPHDRALLDNYALTGSIPNAVFVDGRGKEQKFWDPKFGKPGARAGDGEFFKWGKICGTEDIAKKVFGDGRGPWKDPRP